LAKAAIGVDIILGGHDHCYYINHITSALNKEKDNLIVKSGANYMNLSEIKVKVIDNASSVTEELHPDNTAVNDDNAISDKYYNFVVKDKFHYQVMKKDVTAKIPQNKELLAHVESYYTELDKVMQRNVLVTETQIDFKFGTIRNYEAGFATWICNLINTDMSCDACFFNSGSFRSDRVYEPGYVFTLADIFEIFPIETNFCQLELTGKQVLECLENSVSKWPALEGRFLQLGGVQFKYDPKKPGMARITEGSVYIKNHELELSRKYMVCTTGYMALGKDGFDCIKSAKTIIDEENGPKLMDIIKEYLDFPTHVDIREDYDSFQSIREESFEMLEEVYDRKTKAKNMFIAGIQDALNHSLTAGLLGTMKSIKSSKSIDNNGHNHEDDEDEICFIKKNTIKDMIKIKEETKSDLSVQRILAQNGDINTIRRYMKYYLANAYVDDAGAKIWSIAGEKQNSCNQEE